MPLFKMIDRINKEKSPNHGRILGLAAAGFLALGLAAFGFINRKTGAAAIELDSLRLPQGFSVALYAEKVEGARSMAMGREGTLFVGTRMAGKVFALVDRNQDFVSDTLMVIASGLNLPNGIAFHNGSLFVAEVDKLWRYDQIEQRLTNPPQPVLVAQFPKEKWHGWRYMNFGPDGKLYITIGAPCNVCTRENGEYATILRMNPDGSGREVFAKGVRNSVGFDWHPSTGDFWFTENGRDMMGNEVPHDELNVVTRPGQHFGFPHCHAGLFPDPVFGKGIGCEPFEKPVQLLTPHAAALGMRFYTGQQFPESHRQSVFIAEHGSWNSDKPVGYRITEVKLEGGRAVSYTPFAEGWLQNAKAWGRPVDILLMKDGSMLVSDDLANCIYRISYQPVSADLP